ARVHIASSRRFDPPIQAPRDAVRSGELGWLHTVRSTTMDPAAPPAGYLAASGGIFRDCSVHDFARTRSTTTPPPPPPAGYLAASGGIFRDCSVHDFDTIRYVTGREVTEVYAT